MNADGKWKELAQKSVRRIPKSVLMMVLDTTRRNPTDIFITIRLIVKIIKQKF
jgi:hypothetical protein